jgi:hypothetical protein
MHDAQRRVGVLTQVALMAIPISEVINRFSGTSCAGCHSAAEPQFDFVCEDDHGCAPLPVGDDVITAIQNADPRPRT